MALIPCCRIVSKRDLTTDENLVVLGSRRKNDSTLDRQRKASEVEIASAPSRVVDHQGPNRGVSVQSSIRVVGSEIDVGVLPANGCTRQSSCRPELLKAVVRGRGGDVQQSDASRRIVGDQGIPPIARRSTTDQPRNDALIGTRQFGV